MVVRRFEDLDAWRLANELKKGVYALVDGSAARSDRGFRDQILASAAPAPANLAEGFGFYRHPEFARHTRNAKASLTETQHHLHDGVDRGYWRDEQVTPLRHLSNRAVGACIRLLAHLETTDAPGTSAPTAHKAGTTFPRRKRE